MRVRPIGNCLVSLMEQLKMNNVFTKYSTSGGLGENGFTDKSWLNNLSRLFHFHPHNQRLSP